ncbi:PREDICTED: uncharacterized protein LOC109233461 [Nicotiana attenuata]|uniref:uncharacterized protein LOC109233461 n=1 Tax=Nicotiana attenuata TaxID=49451 RepID=UPI0009046A9D|nr:PREDICTED: uncharacterized protein LOC109233461 [Nicotiana attenuata]
MENILVFLQHDGVWESDHSFVNFAVNGILITSECKFEELVSIIATHLEKDMDTNSIDIKYIVKDGYPPMTVHNDMSVRLYIELKRKNSEFTEYPLCITFKDKRTTGSCSNANRVTVSSDGIQSENMPKLYQPDTIELISFVHGEDRNGVRADDKGMINNPEIIKPISSVHGEDCNVPDDKGIKNDPDTIEPISSVPADDCNSIHDDVRGIIDNPRHQDVEQGQLYQDKETLVNVMKHYAIQKKFQFRVERSSSSSYCLVCLDDNCSWTLRSSSLNNSKLFKVRKFNDVHTCSIEEILSKQRHATSEIVGGMIRNKYANAESEYTPADIMRDIKKDYGVDLTYMKAWRAKQKALEILRGNPSKSYGKLPSYLYMLMHTNPGSVVKLHKSEGGSFLYAFVSLDASIKGWEYCKPIVVINGSFLSAGRGTLITAYTQDAAGKIFLLAYSVVDSENDASWEWFFERFRDTYGAREGMCIVSDMHESILKASSVVYPGVLHCVCMFHLWNNIKMSYTKNHIPIKELFFASAKAYTVEEFDRHMAEINNIDKRVGEHLLNVGYHRWSRAHSKVKGTTIMSLNIAESMNAANNYARDLPILHLLEYMMKLVQDWHHANKKNAIETSTKLAKKYEDIMRENHITSQTMTVKPSTDYLCTVIEDEKQFVVNLGERTCTCIRFQIDEMPCPHALAVVTYKSLDAYEYCSIYYSADYLLKTYEIPVYPVSDESTWDIPREILEDVVLPPTGRIKPGRPKKLRIQLPESQAKRCKTSCGQCGQEGHNRKTCESLREKT